MKRTNVAKLLMGAVIAVAPAFMSDARAGVVISQVYGGGGNSGATYTHDFVELFNNGAASVSLAGWSIQYASAAGSGNFGFNSAAITLLPAFSLAAGQYLLIQEAQGAGGSTPLPTSDVTDATPIAISATGAKVALVSTTVSLGCNGGTTPCLPASLALIEDLVGWGGADFFDSAVGPATNNTTSLLRAGEGCTDTNNNSADFSAGTPNPRNSASPLNVCGGGTDVPEPATLLLLGIGVAALGGMRRSPLVRNQM